MHMLNNQQIRKKAPQLIVAGIAIAVVVYILFEILEDVFIELTGHPWSGGSDPGGIA